MDYVFIKSQKKGCEHNGNIRARVRYGGKVYKISIGLMVTEHEWKKYKSLKYVSTAIMPSLGIKYAQFANILMQIKHKFEEDFVPSQASSVIHHIVYANIVSTNPSSAILQPPVIALRNSPFLTTYISGYIADLKSGTRTRQRRSTPVSTGYINNIAALLKNIEGYEVTLNRKLLLDDVSIQFQRHFMAYLRDTGHKPNTISTRFGDLRTIMQVAYLERKTTGIDHQSPHFVPCKEEADEIFLKPEQISQMTDLDLSSKEAIEDHIRRHRLMEKRKKPLPLMTHRFIRYLNYTRDIFIVGCLTGQRYSDYRRINKRMLESLNGKPFIRLVQQKTGKQVYIPLDRRVMNILDRYEGSLPYVGATTFRHHLRLIGELLGWTHQAVFDTGSNHACHRFCDMLTTHTARRSFATNAYSAGIALASIIAVTGHSSERCFRTYIRLDTREKATMAAENFKDFIHT